MREIDAKASRPEAGSLRDAAFVVFVEVDPCTILDKICYRTLGELLMSHSCLIGLDL